MKNLKSMRGNVCSLVLSVALVLLMALPLAAQPTTLRFTSYNPPRGMEAECAVWLMESIEKRTNGEVKFE